MRLKHLALALPLLLLPIGLPNGFAEPRDGWDLAARVPASTLAFLTTGKMTDLKALSEKTAFGRMLKDPAMQPFWAPLEKALQEMADPNLLPPLAREALQKLQGIEGRVSAALLDVSEEADGPVLVASIDFGPQVGELGTFLEHLAAEAGSRDLELTTETKDGRPWWSLKVRRGPTLTATTVDTTFVIATSPALLTSVVGAPAPQGTLAGTADFRAVAGKVGREGLGLLLFGSVTQALERFAGDWKGEERRLADAMGLDTVRAVGYGLTFAGDGYRDTLIVHAPGADHGLLPLLRLPALERPRLLDLAPANAFAFSEANLPLDTLMASVRTLAARFNDNAVGEIDGGLERVSREVGVDLEKEVLAGLSGGVGSYCAMPQGGGLYPEVALMLTVKDPAAYEGILTRLTDGIAGSLNERGRVIARTRTMAFEGRTLHLLELQKAHGGGVVPFTPSWALLGDRLVVTLVPYTLKEIAWRAAHAREAGPGLEAQEDFAALWAGKPAGAGACSYYDLQAVLALLYDTAVPLLQTTVKPNMLGEVGAKLPLDWAALPPARMVRPYFRSLMTFTTLGPDGLEIRLNAPIPILPVAFAVGAATAATMMRMRSVQVSRFEAGRAAFPPDMVVPVGPGEPAPAEGDPDVVARRDLDELMRTVRLFVLAENRLPATLDDLVKEHYLEALKRDPWDHAYRLVVTDRKAQTFAVLSDGPDGSPGTADDIAVAPR